MGNNAGDDFLGLCEKKVSYEHVLDFGFFLIIKTQEIICCSDVHKS
jgi:hypothetical protein